MKTEYLPFSLELTTPALLTGIGGDLNSARSLPYIPGSTLRGVVARALAGQENAERTPVFREVVLSGAVRFLNAYPYVSGRRSLPTPLHYGINRKAVGEAEITKAWDRLAEGADTALSAMAEPFMTLGAAQPARVQPRRSARFHQQRDRERGRAWKDAKEVQHGTVYTYESLDAQQTFAGFVQVRGADEARLAALATAVKGALAGAVLVGRSRRGGYGGDALVTWHAPAEREVAGPGFVVRVSKGQRFRALLTSAYVGRDAQTGQLDPTALGEELEVAFGGAARVVGHCWRFELTGGFIRKWRLEMPQALACAAGSVLVLEADRDIEAEDLLAIEHVGLGERRIDGFGRVAFVTTPPAALSVGQPQTRPTPHQKPEGKPPSIVVTVERRLLEAAVRRNIEDAAASEIAGATRIPSASLLGRLRNPLRFGESGLEVLKTWLQDDGDNVLRRPAADQLKKCRIGPGRVRLWDRLRAIVQTEVALEHLRLAALAQQFQVISPQSVEEYLRDRDAWVRARLIDSMISNLARVQRKGAGRG